MKRANIRFNVNKLFYSYTQFEIMTGTFRLFVFQIMIDRCRDWNNIVSVLNRRAMRHGTTSGQRLAFKALVWCSHALSGWHERLELGSMEPT